MAAPKWPTGCPKPGSCERRRACGYWRCPHRDKGAAVTVEIDAAVAAAEAKANTPLRVVPEPLRAWCAKRPDGTLVLWTIHPEIDLVHLLPTEGWRVVRVEIVEAKDAP